GARVERQGQRAGDRRMAGFWTGLVHGTLLCGATLAALSLGFPRPAPREAEPAAGASSPAAPARPAAVELPAESPTEALPAPDATDALPAGLVEESMTTAPVPGAADTVTDAEAAPVS